MRRAQVHPSVVMNGWPLIRCVPGGVMKLGKDVRINTSVRSNPVIGRKRTSLSVLVSGARLEIEDGVGLSGVCISVATSVRVGRNTLVGADALICDTDFHTPLPDGSWSNDVAASSRPISIGEGCFIGTRAIILKGVTIGDGAVVAAGAVVSRDVPQAHLAAGNPATNRPLPERWRHGRDA
ncbi:hypothetical protein JIN81_12375 [Haloferula rosea]|uniref:Acyltransferase n=2 Tax=Haloferula rosea TaxID=490093 RepID=A0A934RDS0_9BACT|nr:hypothetical protein [Haloferula rosea]